MAAQIKSAPEKVTSGWLYKWTNYVQGYQARWFITANGFISYYRSPGDEVDGLCRGSMRLSAAVVHSNDSKSFVLSSGQATYHLKANTTDERDMWVKAITSEADKMMPVASEESNTLEALQHNLEKKFDQLKSYTSTVRKKAPSFQKELQALMKMDLPPKVTQKLEVLTDVGKLLLDNIKNINMTSDEMLVMSRNLRSELKNVSRNTKQLEEMVEDLGQQHRNLEKKIQQTLSLFKHKKTFPSRQEADEDNDDDVDAEDDEFFDAQTEETTELLIRMPSSKKFKTEEEHNLVPPEVLLARSKSTDSDASADEQNDCIACVFQRKPKQTNDAADDKTQEKRQEKTELPDMGSTKSAARRRSSVRQQKLIKTSRKDSIIPQFNRRQIIPAQASSTSGLWAVLKSFIGKDLSRISLPVCFNEPLTFLQRLTEELEYSDCLDKAARCESSVEQMTHVAAFAISSYATTAARVTKPFNPLLGETYECDRRADYGWKSVAEQVCHHPPTMALHAEGKDWTTWQEFTMLSKFKGHYIQINPVGYCHLLFPKSGNHYTWHKVETTVHNIIVGRIWLDHHGETTITNHQTGDTCQLVFHPYSYVYKNNNRKVTGIVYNAEDEVNYILQGTWDQQMESCLVFSQSASTRGKLSFNTDESVVIWKNTDAQLNSSYGFTRLAIQLNEPEPNVAPTDSRLRPDLRLMEQGDMEEADKVKVLLEEKQRSARRRRQSLAAAKGLEVEQAEAVLYEPKWFKKEDDPQTGMKLFKFTHDYWNCKKKQDWSRCPNIFL